MIERQWCDAHDAALAVHDDRLRFWIFSRQIQVIIGSETRIATGVTAEAPIMPASCDDQARRKFARRLLASTPIIQTVCDLDLLMFLHRHPRALLTTEQLAGFVGYPLPDIVKSLGALIAAGLLDRTAQLSSHAARLFVLARAGSQGDGVRALLELGSTRQGRECIREALQTEGARPNRPGTSPEQQANRG